MGAGRNSPRALTGFAPAGQARRRREQHMAAESRIGVTGLAVMGANLARNIARHGVPVAVHNRTAARTEEFMSEHAGEGDFTASESVEDFVKSLERPRRIIVMVKAGPPVDGVIEELAP